MSAPGVRGGCPQAGDGDRDQESEADQAEEVQEEITLLDQIIDEGRMALDESKRELAKDILSEFVSQIMEGVMVVSKDTEAMINNRISQIDKLISDQLNEIMHHPDFQKMEGSLTYQATMFEIFQNMIANRATCGVMDTLVNEKKIMW